MLDEWMSHTLVRVADPFPAPPPHLLLQVLSSTKDLKTSACVAGSRPLPEIRRILNDVPREIREKYYGCECDCMACCM